MSARTYVYVRVSTLLQHEEGNGEEQQLKSVLEYHKRHDLPPLAPNYLFSDQVSTKHDARRAKNFLDRDGAKALMAALQPGDHLIVYSVCRLGRSYDDTIKSLIYLDELKIQVHVSSQPELNPGSTIGKIILSLLAGMAQIDNDYRSERAKQAFALEWENGRRIGGNLLRPGYRYSDEKKNQVVPDEREQALCNLIREYYERGMRIYAIYCVLKALGVKRADQQEQKGSGGYWTRHRIRNALAATSARRPSGVVPASESKRLWPEFERAIRLLYSRE